MGNANEEVQTVRYHCGRRVAARIDHNTCFLLQFEHGQTNIFPMSVLEQMVEEIRVSFWLPVGFSIFSVFSYSCFC